MKNKRVMTRVSLIRIALPSPRNVTVEPAARAKALRREDPKRHYQHAVFSAATAASAPGSARDAAAAPDTGSNTTTPRARGGEPASDAASPSRGQ